MVGSVIWFGAQTYAFFREIKSGNANILLERRLQSSVSRAVANANVTQADLDRLAKTDAPSTGPADAPLTIVEFVDYDCPFSRASFEPVRELSSEYATSVRLIIRDFPLEDIHPGAMRKAMAARCAHEQGKFWPYHDKLYVNQDAFQEGDLDRFAREVGLDMVRFDACLTGERTRSLVETDVADGLRAGVQGTPTFFFNGVRIQGGLDRDILRFLIEDFLKRARKNEV